MYVLVSSAREATHCDDLYSVESGVKPKYTNYHLYLYLVVYMVVCMAIVYSLSLYYISYIECIYNQPSADTMLVHGCDYGFMYGYLKVSYNSYRSSVA